MCVCVRERERRGKPQTLTRTHARQKLGTQRPPDPPVPPIPFPFLVVSVRTKTEREKDTDTASLSPQRKAGNSREPRGGKYLPKAGRKEYVTLFRQRMKRKPPVPFFLCLRNHAITDPAPASRRLCPAQERTSPPPHFQRPRHGGALPARKLTSP